MEIRKALKKDLKNIAEIFKIETAKAPYKEKRTSKKSLERITEYYQKKDIYVVIIEKEIIGFIILSINPDNNKKVYIDELWLKKSYQRQGIGKNLIKQIENIYKKRGVKIIRLVSMRNSKAFKFYKKINYNELKTMVFMEKKL